MVLTVISGVIFLFLLLFQCQPISYFWTRVLLDPSITGSCIDINILVVMMYVHSGFSALCDFTVGILPVFIVYTLQMKKRTKVGVICILGMACMCVFAIQP
jgi:hypothetical protein